MTYTALAVLAVAASVLLDLAVLRTRLLGRRAFWVAYAIVVGFQLVTDAWLTGRRIVTYSPSAILGEAAPRLFGDGRLAYAPVEDLLFGFALVVQSLSWWVFWGRRRARRARSSAGPATARRRESGTLTRRSRTR